MTCPESRLAGCLITDLGGHSIGLRSIWRTSKCRNCDKYDGSRVTLFREKQNTCKQDLDGEKENGQDSGIYTKMYELPGLSREAPDFVMADIQCIQRWHQS